MADRAQLAELREAHERAHTDEPDLSPDELAAAERLDARAQLLELGIPAERVPEAGHVWIVVGKMGSHKSTWAKAQAATWPDRVRVVVFDYCDEWSPYGKKSRHTRPGPMTKRVTLDELAEHPEILDEPYLRLAVVPRGTRAERAEDFRQLIEILGVDGTGRDRDLVLIVEEVWATAALARDEYGTLATLGRHSGLAMVFIAQWASAIPHEVRRQAALVAAHRQDFDIDIDALTPPMPREQAERVRLLKRGEREIWRESAADRDHKPAGKSRDSAA